MSVRRTTHRRGFTLVELLAVIATIAILASLLLPILGKARIRAQRTACSSNLKQLGLAWLTYSDDYNGHLVQSYPLSPGVWVEGDMTDPLEATNVALLHRGKLWPYVQSESIFRCPTDHGVTIGGTRVRNTRSYSMNAFMGARQGDTEELAMLSSGFTPFFTKVTEIPRPADLWVLLDEDERSIDDGFFVTDPRGRVWVDFPAISDFRHAFTYGLNFADGHSDIFQHRDQRTKDLSGSWTEAGDNPDLKRLAERTTVRLQMPP